jgi:hypothetical protein
MSVRPLSLHLCALSHPHSQHLLHRRCTDIASPNAARARAHVCLSASVRLCACFNTRAPAAASVFTYTERDCILYALSVGFSGEDELHPDDLQYTYELGAGFSVVPTFAVLMGFGSMGDLMSVRHASVRVRVSASLCLSVRLCVSVCVCVACLCDRPCLSAPVPPSLRARARVCVSVCVCVSSPDEWRPPLCG